MALMNSGLQRRQTRFDIQDSADPFQRKLNGLNKAAFQWFIYRSTDQEEMAMGPTLRINLLKIETSIWPVAISFVPPRECWDFAGVDCRSLDERFYIITCMGSTKKAQDV